MEQSNRHGQPPSQGTANEIRQFLRTRKRVPVNTGLILINILVFLAVELTGSALDTSHMLHWGAAYVPDILQAKGILSTDNSNVSTFRNTAFM